MIFLNDNDFTNINFTRTIDNIDNVIEDLERKFFYLVFCNDFASNIISNLLLGITDSFITNLRDIRYTYIDFVSALVKYIATNSVNYFVLRSKVDDKKFKDFNILLDANVNKFILLMNTISVYHSILNTDASSVVNFYHEIYFYNQRVIVLPPTVSAVYRDSSNNLYTVSTNNFISNSFVLTFNPVPPAGVTLFNVSYRNISCKRNIYVL